MFSAIRIPTPAEIETECRLIREDWDEAEYAMRAGLASDRNSAAAVSHWRLPVIRVSREAREITESE